MRASHKNANAPGVVLLVSVGMGSLKRYWPVCVGSAKRSVAECGRGLLRGARFTALPRVQVRAEGAGTTTRPGVRVTATPAAKFRGFETRWDSHIMQT